MFWKKSKSKIILWDTVHQNCFTPEEQKIKVQSTETGKRFLVLKNNKTLYSFFPELSPFPVDKNLNVIKDSPFRIFSKKYLKKHPIYFFLELKLLTLKTMFGALRNLMEKTTSSTMDGV